MTAIAPESAPGQGKLVALEGNVDSIATQLRLLPPSQKFLVLPSLTENLIEQQEGDLFDARLFVRDLHHLFTERTEKARSFLQSSTDTHPKLVFMNGGSSKARQTCISKISEHITDGDIEEAHVIFNEIVEDGVSGLMKHAAEAEAEAAETDESTNDSESLEDEDEEDEDEDDEEDGVHGEVDGAPGKEIRESTNPALKAMKLADSLDRKTAALEPEEPTESASQIDTDLRDEPPYAGKKKSIDRVLRSTDSSQKSQSISPVVSPEYKARDIVPTTPNSEDIRTTIMTLPAKASPKDKRNTFGPHTHTVTSSTASDASQAKSDFTDDVDADTDLETLIDPEIISLKSENIASVPATPKVEYGKAFIVDVPPAEKKTQIRKISSVDRFFPSLLKHDASYLSPRSLKHTTSAYHLRSKPMTADGFCSGRDGSDETPPRLAFARASQSLLNRSPSDLDCKWPSTKSVLVQTSGVFVDRGTDPGLIPENDSNEIEEHSPFVAVFPLVEDLVINMNPKGFNPIFDTVIASYMDGSYPAFPELEPTLKAEHNMEALGSPVSSLPAANEPSTPLESESRNIVEADEAGYLTKDTYDPYATESYAPAAGMQRLPDEGLNRPESAVQSKEPPTTIAVIPTAGVAGKFLDFLPVNVHNAISVQNSLRQVLGAQFPTHLGYTQHFYAAGASADRLWKPVFRNEEDSALGNEGRTVDQIVALGSEDGVKSDFFAQVSGQIEKLGIKLDGYSRSGKLDIRFLIWNVLQAPNIPLEVQSDPLADPHLLATLLVTQLEAFLAVNNNTRLLVLQYSSEHLATILALRKLLGISLFKVAGILDTLASDPPSFNSRRTPPGTNPLSNEATSARSAHLNPRLNSLQSANRKDSIQTIHESKKTDPEVSFSKANYLLPSAATDAEITTFLSVIWKVLMEKSAFYAPDPQPKPAKIEQPPRTPVPKTPTASIHRDRDRERDSGYPPSSFRAPRDRESKISRLTGISNPQGGSNNRYAPSIASTTRTTASERGRREDRDWENFYVGEEDSEDDAYDKMILGRGYAKIVPEVRKVGQKRNTKKALKWLGLA